jgi:hypothetical protein
MFLNSEDKLTWKMVIPYRKNSTQPNAISTKDEVITTDTDKTEAFANCFMV